MSNQQLTVIDDHARAQPMVAMRVGAQLFGIPVPAVRDVTRLPQLTPIPLAPPVIAGLWNANGTLVTVLDMRARLGLPPREAEGAEPMLVLVEHQQERFGLIVDRLMEVMWLAPERAEPVPTTMNPHWRDIAANIYTMGEELLVILHLAHTLDHAVS